MGRPLAIGFLTLGHRIFLRTSKRKPATKRVSPRPAALRLAPRRARSGCPLGADRTPGMIPIRRVLRFLYMTRPNRSRWSWSVRAAGRTQKSAPTSSIAPFSVRFESAPTLLGLDGESLRGELARAGTRRQIPGREISYNRSRGECSQPSRCTGGVAHGRRPVRHSRDSTGGQVGPDEDNRGQRCPRQTVENAVLIGPGVSWSGLSDRSSDPRVQGSIP